MRLPRPFFRLPLRFDAERLRAEVGQMPAEAWARHPNEVEGNSSVRLISVEGAENDEVDGVMLATEHLRRAPYIRQVLASFGVVWSRSRLMRLAPGAGVPPHADINYHWYTRVRLHVPIVTRPEVRFSCGDQEVHMAAGEAWLFDNWRQHRVENPTPAERIHLVADTSGTAAFWQFVLGSQQLPSTDRLHAFEPSLDVMPLTEHATLAPVMHPAEVELLLLDLRSELVAADPSPAMQSRLPLFHAMLEGFCKDWRQLYLLYGSSPAGWPEFERLRDSLRTASREHATGLAMRTNGVEAHRVLEGRLLRAALVPPKPARYKLLDRPTFIVSAPRAGSTLLFETLAASARVATLGGEAHWLIEDIPDLRPGAAGVDSNRLIAEHCSPAIAGLITDRIVARAQRLDGAPAGADAALRFLEKTPKNSLRIPFLNCLFPDARFIFLWRDPRENLSSIIEAWRSGKWQTYAALEGFDGPWSLLLPPGWQALRGKPLEDVAAFQWDTSNRIIMDDLSTLARQRWTIVNYDALVSDTMDSVRRLCDFTGFEMDVRLLERVSGPLPWSRYTHTAPASDKWRKNEFAISRVLPSLAATTERLRALDRI